VYAASMPSRRRHPGTPSGRASGALMAASGAHSGGTRAARAGGARGGARPFRLGRLDQLRTIEGRATTPASSKPGVHAAHIDRYVAHSAPGRSWLARSAKSVDHLEPDALRSPLAPAQASTGSSPTGETSTRGGLRTSSSAMSRGSQTMRLLPSSAPSSRRSQLSSHNTRTRPAARADNRMLGCQSFK
jgi:hypothetical protein